MIVLSVLALILWLFIIPMCMGLLLQGLLPYTKKTIGITFLCGFILSFAVFGVVSIPCMVLLKYGAFKMCVRVFATLEILLSVSGVFVTAKRVGEKIRSGYVSKFADGFTGSRIRAFMKLIFPGEEKADPSALISPRTDVRVMKVQYSLESYIFWGIFFLIVLF